MRKTLQERFDEKYIPEPNSGCWLWDAAYTAMGYGRIAVNKRVKAAHRVSYELHVGPIPKGLLVLHTCDVTSCVNPDHLFIGTFQDNMDDMMKKGRNTPCIGERGGRAKLSEEDAIAILSDERSNVAVAKEYGVSDVAISYLRIGRSWKHLDRS